VVVSYPPDRPAVINLEVNTATSDAVTLRILRPDGSTVYEGSFPVTVGANSIQTDLVSSYSGAKLGVGTYIYLLYNNSGSIRKTGKFLVK
jgi:hypothetical protein